jgi:hypothetical protein
VRVPLRDLGFDEDGLGVDKTEDSVVALDVLADGGVDGGDHPRDRGVQCDRRHAAGGLDHAGAGGKLLFRALVGGLQRFRGAQVGLGLAHGKLRLLELAGRAGVLLKERLHALEGLLPLAEGHPRPDGLGLRFSSLHGQLKLHGVELLLAIEKRQEV